MPEWALNRHEVMLIKPNYNPDISQPFSTDTLSEEAELKNQVAEYRQRLETQWEDLKTNAVSYGKQALIIGGVLLTAYALLQKLLPDEEEEIEDTDLKPLKAQRESDFSVASAIQTLAWTLAANWAKEKLYTYMQEERETNASSEE
jgi:hypothetical protein